MCRFALGIIWLVLLTSTLTSTSQGSDIDRNKKVTDAKPRAATNAQESIDIDLAEIKCPLGDPVCDSDKLGFEAIRQLHEQIDDDKDGKVDMSESDEFMRDELHYESGFDRHNTLHHGDDMVTFQEMWISWINSNVYNWTVDDVLDWLVNEVGLDQYAPIFKAKDVTGKILPRVAVNVRYKTDTLGIKNGVHKQKLSLKATDAVLFGPPKKAHSWIKDLVVVSSIAIALGGCWLAYVQQRRTEEQLKKVNSELESLQKAEEDLTKMQTTLQKVQQDKSLVQEEKKKLESKLESEISAAKREAEVLKQARESTMEDVSRLEYAEDEVAKLNVALRKAEEELLRLRHNIPIMIPELQTWLQLTYEVEAKHYERKKEYAQKQLLQAKEMCEKIRKKRSAFMGSFRIAHTTSMDDTDTSIMNARAALEDVRNDLQERTQRWGEIERLCSFAITTNPGIKHLNAQLKGPSHITGSRSTVNPYAQGTVGDGEDEGPPAYSDAAASPAGRDVTSSHQNLSRNNLSPTSDDDGIRKRSGSNNSGSVDFYLGKKANTNSKSDLQEHLKEKGATAFVKSHSVEHSQPVVARPVTLPSSLSDSHLKTDGLRHSRDQPSNGILQFRKAANVVRAVTSPTEEEESSPESGENGSQNSLDLTPSKEKKKKSKLFSKLLKKKKVPTATLR